MSKIYNHLRYLNSEQVAFSFFDDNLGKSIKTSMVNKLTSAVDNDPYNIDDMDVKAKINSKEVHNFFRKGCRFLHGLEIFFKGLIYIHKINDISTPQNSKRLKSCKLYS